MIKKNLELRKNELEKTRKLIQSLCAQRQILKRFLSDLGLTSKSQSTRRE